LFEIFSVDKGFALPVSEQTEIQ